MYCWRHPSMQFFFFSRNYQNYPWNNIFFFSPPRKFTYSIILIIEKILFYYILFGWNLFSRWPSYSRNSQGLRYYYSNFKKQEILEKLVYLSFFFFFFTQHITSQGFFSSLFPFLFLSLFLSLQKIHVLNWSSVY